MSVTISIPKGELREACQGITKITNGKSTLPVLSCVKFDTSASGVVAQATDLEQVLEYRFPSAQVEGHDEGSCIIPLKTLKELGKGAKDENVEIWAESPEHITLVNHVGGQAIQKPVAGMEPDEWPAMDTNVKTKPAQGFIDTYRRLVPFSSTDETRYVLNSVYTEVGKGKNSITMAATDGCRLACFNSMALPINKSIVVPITKFLAWTKLPRDVEIGIREDKEPTLLGVKAGPFTYSVKTIEGTYPNFRQVIPAEPGPNVITFMDSDVNLLRQVLTTLPGDQDIILVGDDGKVTLYGRGSGDERWTTLTLENTTYWGERKFMGLNRRYLLDALAAGFREFAISAELSPLLSRDGEGGTHVLMPLRVQDPVETKTVEAAAEDTMPKSAPEPEPKAEKTKLDDTGASKKVHSTEEDAPSRQVDDQDQGAVTAPDRPTAKPQTRRKNVTKQNEQKNETSALDRVHLACNDARTKVREAGQALTELSKAIRDANREQKSDKKEVEAAKTAIAKVQQIKLAA